jgi:hypothetical protein
VPSVVVSGNVVVPNVGQVVITGIAPEIVQQDNIFKEPLTGPLSIASEAPIIGFGIVTPSGAIVATGIAPRTDNARIPGTVDLTATGIAPRTDSARIPGVGSINVVGIAPSVVGGKVITPTGTALLLGSAPSIVVSGNVDTPAVGTLTLVGIAPLSVVSKVITPARGTLTLVGGTVTLSNPNWGTIDTSQTPGWGTIDTSQTPNWVQIAA